MILAPRLGPRTEGLRKMELAHIKFTLTPAAQQEEEWNPMRTSLD